MNFIEARVLEELVVVDVGVLGDFQFDGDAGVFINKLGREGDCCLQVDSTLRARVFNEHFIKV